MGKQKKPARASGSESSQNQLWFFLTEDASNDTFNQNFYTLDEIKTMELTLKHCLKLSGVDDKANPQDFRFWIHSQSMTAAVEMITDKSILVTYNLYCSTDPVIHIIIRKHGNGSPNNSFTPSHAASLALRQQHSAKRGLLAPELFLQPKVRHVSGSTDVMTFEEISDEGDMVSVVYDGDTITFHRHYLYGVIDAGLADLKRPTEITVHGSTPDGQFREFQLTPNIWQSYLVRGPWRKYFAGVWDTSNRAQAEREEILAEIKLAEPSFEKSCEAFISDLRHYDRSEKSMKRLDSTADKYFLGQRYFNNDIRSRILQLPVTITTQVQPEESMSIKCSTLQEALDGLFKKRSDTTVCAAHDLSPLMEAALGLSWDKTKQRVSTIPSQSSNTRLSFRGAKEFFKNKGSQIFRKKGI